MQAEHLILDFSCDWQTLKNISKHLPNEVSPIFSQAFVIKSIKFVDFSVLVVATQDGDA